MKHVSILIPKGQFSIVNIAGSFQILNWANDAFFQKTRNPLFEIQFVGHEKPTRDFEGYYSVMPPRIFHEITKTDLIIVPAVHGDLNTVIEENALIIDWVQKQYQEGAEVAAFCVGAFLLAKTGILNGKVCSTHWGHAEELQLMFPEIKVEAENIVTESNGIYTSGGAYAFTNLVIYLIEKYAGRELAILTAKAFMVDIDKSSQSPFSIFTGQKNHKDETILKIQQFIEKNYERKFTIDQLASDYAMTKRTLERRFRNATGNSIKDYTQRVRVEAAKKLLELSRNRSINEVMYQSGYNDSKAFRDVFKKYAGISPVKYREKYNLNYLTL